MSKRKNPETKNKGRLIGRRMSAVVRKGFSVLSLFAIVACVLWISGFSSNAMNTLPTGDMNYIPLVKDGGEIELSSEQLAKITRKTLNTGLEKGDHYNYLSDKEKILYEALYTGIKNKQYLKYVDNNKKDDPNYVSDKLYKFYTGDKSFLDFYANTTEFSYALNRAAEACYYDHPDQVEYYMVHGYTIYTSTNQSGQIESCLLFVAEVDDTQFATYDTEITNAVQDLKNTIDGSFSGNQAYNNWPAVKEKFAHDYYCTEYNLVYDRACAALSGNAGYFDYAHTAYGSLVTNKAVCDGYSAGFELLMEALQIKSMIVTGEGGRGTLGGHAWNIVQLDGNWYEVDTTWADNDTNNPDHAFFNSTTQKYKSGINGAYHIRTANDGYLGYKLPVARGTHWTFSYLQKGSYANDTSVFAESIQMDKEISINVGDTATPTITVLPQNATDKNFTLSTSNKSIVSISGTTIKGEKEGTATITATLDSDADVYTTCEVTVNAVHVTSITVPNTLEVKIGETAELTATIEPANATNKNYSLTSSNSQIVSVEGTTIKGVNAGTATITAITEDGGLTAMCEVTVPENIIHVTGISIPNTMKIEKGKTAQIKATITPENATNPAFTLTSSDSKIVKVDGTTIEAVKAGTATITATSADGGLTASCNVTVTFAKGDKVTKNGLIYKIKGNNEAELVGRNTNTKTISIPASIKFGGETYKITSVGSKAFYKDKNVRNIKGGNNLEKIGNLAFSNCQNLVTVSLLTAASLKEIQTKAFYKCKKAKTFNINVNNLSKVGGKAFKYTKKNAKYSLKTSKKSKFKKARNLIKKAGANKESSFKQKK